MTLPDFFRSFNCASAAGETSSSLPRKNSQRKIKRNASNLSANSHPGGATAPQRPDLVDGHHNDQEEELFEGKSFYEIGRYKGVCLKHYFK